MCDTSLLCGEEPRVHWQSEGIIHGLKSVWWSDDPRTKGTRLLKSGKGPRREGKGKVEREEEKERVEEEEEETGRQIARCEGRRRRNIGRLTNREREKSYTNRNEKEKKSILTET